MYATMSFIHWLSRGSGSPTSERSKQPFTRPATSSSMFERELKSPGAAYFFATTINGEALGCVPSPKWQLVHESLLPT